MNFFKCEKTNETFPFAFSSNFSTAPGDIIDNDCDGFVDEELNNAIGKPLYVNLVKRIIS